MVPPRLRTQDALEVECTIRGDRASAALRQVQSGTACTERTGSVVPNVMRDASVCGWSLLATRQVPPFQQRRRPNHDAQRPSSPGGNRRRSRLLPLRWNWWFGVSRSTKEAAVFISIHYGEKLLHGSRLSVGLVRVPPEIPPHPVDPPNALRPHEGCLRDWRF